jgi:CRP-like cAMP-binding protein
MEPQIDSLRNFIKNITAVPPGILDEICASFTPVEYNKGDYLVKEGRLSDNYLFLETGFFRAYTFDQEGNEVTTGFYGNNSVSFEVYSFFNRTASRENIQALTTSCGWIISYEKLNHLFHALPAFRDFGRAVLVRGFSSLKQRMLAMINETAEQRYATLLSQNPEVFQFAPLKDIASFLGITDTSLSRIRKNLSQK